MQLLGCLGGSVGWAPNSWFRLSRDLTVCGIEPRSGFCADSAETAWDSLSPSLYLPHPTRVHTHTLSLSLKINKFSNKVKIKIKCTCRVSALLSCPLFPCSVFNKLLSPLFCLGWILSPPYHQPSPDWVTPHLVALTGNLCWSGTFLGLSGNFLGLFPWWMDSSTRWETEAQEEVIPPWGSKLQGEPVPLLPFGGTLSSLSFTLLSPSVV